MVHPREDRWGNFRDLVSRESKLLQRCRQWAGDCGEEVVLDVEVDQAGKSLQRTFFQPLVGELVLVQVEPPELGGVPQGLFGQPFDQVVLEVEVPGVRWDVGDALQVPVVTVDHVGEAGGAAALLRAGLKLCQDVLVWHVF